MQRLQDTKKNCGNRFSLPFLLPVSLAFVGGDAEFPPTPPSHAPADATPPGTTLAAVSLRGGDLGGRGGGGGDVGGGVNDSSCAALPFSSATSAAGAGAGAGAAAAAVVSVVFLTGIGGGGVVGVGGSVAEEKPPWPPLLLLSPPPRPLSAAVGVGGCPKGFTSRGGGRGPCCGGAGAAGGFEEFCSKSAAQLSILVDKLR